MLGARIFISSLLAAGCLPAQEYFPLHTGNSWTYQVSGRVPGEPVAAEVGRSESINGRDYYLLTGLSRDPAWVRYTGQGQLIALDRATNIEALWVDFAAAEGATYRTAIDLCSPTAVVKKKGETVKTPAGEFVNAILIAYPPDRCADAGLTSEAYAAGVGLVERRSTSFAGERVMQLVRARVGGVNVYGAPETSFTIALDRSVYKLGNEPRQLVARLTLRHTSETPLKLVFNGGQTYDLILRNERGDVVYRWSDGRAFTMIYREEEFGRGEKTFVVDVVLDAKVFAPGAYVAEGRITSEKPYVATTAFTIE